MSIVLLEFSRSFTRGRLSADIFSDAYIELWKIERDKGISIRDDANLSEILSSIFCVADMYCGDDASRRDYELDSIGLRREVENLLSRFDESDDV